MKTHVLALRLRVMACAVSSIFAARPAAALTINLGNTSGMDANALAGFQTAANYWSSALTNDVTINVDVGYSPLGINILGQTSSSIVAGYTSDVRGALTTHATSPSDATAISHLQSGSSLSFVINDPTTGIPYTSSSSTNVLNTQIKMTTANARALGLYSGPGHDATITFSSNYSWDFNRSDGISTGTYDFIGCAIHEIGHALGFISGVDTVDEDSKPKGSGVSSFDNMVIVTPLDLFRYSASGVMNIADGGTPYFSIDGGVSSLGQFSTGVLNGDGRQASHWKDNPSSLGIMDPTAAPGELMTVTPLDLQAMDVIGYTVAAVPEPATAGMLLILGAGSLLCRRRKA